MQADRTLSYEEADNLSPHQRAEALSKNPMAAATLFHCRAQSILDTFLFGETSPFGEIVSYLGRV